MSAASLVATARRSRRFALCWRVLPPGMGSGRRLRSWSSVGIRPMRIEILTLFPEICRAPLNESMMKRAQESGALQLRIHNLRDWTTDKHHVVDDAPFGGGQGMVMKPEPIFAAVEDLQSKIENPKSKIILMSPAGRKFDQQMATDLS